MKKILVLGKSGQLGQEVTAVFSDKEKYEVIAPDEKDADITIPWKIKDLIVNAHPDVIVNCAAFTNVDKCETDLVLAEAVNSLGPEYIAKAALETNSFFIHISTDYVYNGETGFKKVTYKLNGIDEKPLNNYGKTKLRGEEFIAQQMDDYAKYNYVILRTSGLYGKYGNNFLKKIEGKTDDRSAAGAVSVSLVADQWYCPTSALQLAKQIKIWADFSKEDREFIINRKGNVLNANNIGFTSPYLFVSTYLILNDRGYQLEYLDPISFDKYFNALHPETARRPKSVILKNDLAEFGAELCPFTTIEEALHEYVMVCK
jgi:dTDP-4-dehydrorhamnose reductase